MDLLHPLLDRTLIIVAHPDDECIACGALMQRMAEPIVAFCTDGAPRDSHFWQAYCSRELYARVRQEEARRALQYADVKDTIFLAESAHDGFVDQELFRAIPKAYELLAETVAARRPNALLTLAYEGGHPDHDTCNFLASVLAQEFELPAFEAPLYRRNPSALSADAPLELQTFLGQHAAAIEVKPTLSELNRKRAMCAEYRSQGDFLGSLCLHREILRPLPSHNYNEPPHPGLLNYEAWGWSMTGADLTAAFTQFLGSRNKHAFLEHQATGNLQTDSYLRR